MLRPSHRNKSFVAQRCFTDREPAKASFLRLLEKKQRPDEYRILTFYGVGGEGKTALCREFSRILEDRKKKDKNLGWASLNFEESSSRSPLQALLSLRMSLRKTAGIHFPAFDTAFLRYFNLTNPGVDIKTRHPELFRFENEHIQDLIEAGSNLAGSGTFDNEIILDLIEAGSNVVDRSTLGAIAPIFYKYSKRMSTGLQNWLKRRGSEVLEDIDDLSADKLIQNLPIYFGADLADSQFRENEKKSHQKRIVVFMDTYEALWRSHGTKNGPGSLRMDEWVRSLVKECPGVLFVLLGRDISDIERWKEEDKDWHSVIESHRLGTLSMQDADRFLQAIPIPEEEIREKIVASASGLPFYLDLQVSLYESIKNSEEELTSKEFGDHHTEIISRFMDHVGEQAQRALQIMAHPRSFDESVFHLLAENFLGGTGSIPLATTTEYSFIERNTNGDFSMNALMRDYLVEKTLREEPKLAVKLNECLFTWHDEKAKIEDTQKITPSHEAALKEAAYHLEHSSPENFPAWTNERCTTYQNAGRYDLTKALYQRAIDIGNEVLGEEDSRTLTAISNLARTLHDMGHLTEAEKLQVQTLKVQRRVLGNEDPETLRSMNNLACTLHSLGNSFEAQKLQIQVLEKLDDESPESLATKGNLAMVLAATGDLNRAQELQEQLLKTYERTCDEDDPNRIRATRDLAQTIYKYGDLIRAKEFQEHALKAFERVLGEENPESLDTKNCLACTYHGLGDLPRAQALQEQVLQIKRQQLGENHHSTLSSINNLGITLTASGDFTGARKLQEQTIKSLRQAFGEEHPHTLRSTGNLAVILQKEGKLIEAKEIQEQVLKAQLQVLGAEHPNTLSTINNLALTLCDQKNYLGATMLYKQAVEGHIKKFGKEHYHTLDVMYNLAMTYIKDENTAEAEKLLKQLLETQRRVLGDKHPGTVNTMFSLAHMLHLQKKTGARELLEKIMEGLQSSRGEKHPETLAAINNLSAILALVRTQELETKHRKSKNSKCLKKKRKKSSRIR